MKYFLLFWILVLQEILSLSQATNTFFHQNNLGEINKNQIFNAKANFLLEGDRSFKNERSKNYIVKRDADIDTQTLSSIAKCVKGIIDSGLTNLKQTVIYYPFTLGTTPICTKQLKKLPSYQSVVCTHAPGKIICQLGRFNFVINNKDHHMDNAVIEKFITMAYRRYGEGDDCFDVAVDERETTPCACYTTQVKPTPQETQVWDQPPVTVECNVVSNEKLKMCNPNFEPTEKIYQCKSKTLGLKKRNILHISVNDNGIVSFTKDPMLVQSKVRKKREENDWQVSKGTKRKRNNRRRRELPRLNDYNDEDTLPEPDISNLYYHTKIPFVRNYTDHCTLKYQFYPWCPEYISNNPCSKSTTLNPNETLRPCRQVNDTKGSCESTTEATGSNTTIECTTEMTEEVNFKQKYSDYLDRRKRLGMYLRKTRRLPKPFKFISKTVQNTNDVDGKNGANSTLQSTSTTVSPACNSASSTTLITMETSTASTQWCTTTVSCTASNNIINTTINIPTSNATQMQLSNETHTLRTELSCMDLSITSTHSQPLAEVNNLLQNPVNYIQGDRYVHQGITGNNFVQIESKTNKPIHYHESLSIQEPQYRSLKSFQMPPPVSRLENRVLPKQAIFNNAKYHTQNILHYPNGRLQTFNSDLRPHLKTKYRPKRKMFPMMIPNFRRKLVKNWLNKHIPHASTYDEE